jgi:hypothetical protein
MSWGLALPFFIATGLALAALVAGLEWPRIRVYTHSEAHHGFRIVEIAFILRAGGAKVPAEGDLQPRRGAEFVIYLTRKTGSF